jgi:dienelactone hydrolase
VSTAGWTSVRTAARQATEGDGEDGSTTAALRREGEHMSSSLRPSIWRKERAMAELVLFHHAQGLTEGMRAFADRLRSAGHHVTLPDLCDGATFSTVEEGVAHAEVIGFDEIVSRGVAAVADLPAELVYGGFSLGALPAQKLAQNRPGAKAVLLYEGGVPLSTFGGAWARRRSLADPRQRGG